MTHTTADRDDIVSKFDCRGYGCVFHSDAPGKEWVNYAHDRDELLYVLEGTLEVTLCEHEGDRTVVLQPGDELLIPEGMNHTAKAIGEGQVVWVQGLMHEYAGTD